MAYKNITAEAFAAIDFSTVNIVDLREPDEVLVKGFEDAINISFSEFYSKLDEVPKGKPVYFI